MSAERLSPRYGPATAIWRCLTPTSRAASVRSTWAAAMPLSGETLSGRVIAALKSNSLLNESVGAGYIDRNWPPALLKPGAWPLSSLRQAFVSGALTRLVDPDATLRRKVKEFVESGDFGLASGQQPDGSYSYVWFHEPLQDEEIAFDAGVFLLRKDKAQALKLAAAAPPAPQPPDRCRTRRPDQVIDVQSPLVDPQATICPPAPPRTRTLKIAGQHARGFVEPGGDTADPEAAQRAGIGSPGGFYRQGWWSKCGEFAIGGNVGVGGIGVVRR